MKLPLILLCLAASLPVHADTVSLASVTNPRGADNENARPALNKTTRNEPLRIAGRTFADGVGTQVDTRLAFDLGGATRFTATAGVDDATEATDAVRFEVRADGQTLWRQDLKKGQAPVSVDVDLRGRKHLELVTADVGNAFTQALADWADAQLTYTGEKPKAGAATPITEPREILTPAPGPAPRINGAHVFGVRPGSPFLFTIPATGTRPMTFSAANLPEGLKLDEKTGRISGKVTQPGTYRATLRAKNDHGMSESPLRIEVGEKIALTPPMGWNSWNCWGTAVDQKKVLQSAQAMASKGLINHGWTYINIDDTWQGKRTGPDDALEGNEKFPDLGGLARQVHGLGLKIGIYSTPWDTSYAGFAGGSSDNADGAWSPALINDAAGRKRRHHGSVPFATADARQWAAWGIDYLKYDWNPRGSNPPESPEQFHQYVAAMAKALRDSGRDLVYSYSNSMPFELVKDQVDQLQLWRTTGDITDTWGSLRNIWFQQPKWRPYSGPGHWNDPDMLIVGNVGWGPKLHPSRLTPNEQYTHLSLWCLLSAPLLIGCPIEQMDDFTLNLLTNDEVLALDQDELGAAAEQVLVDGRRQIFVKPLADGSHAIGLFNLAQEPQDISATWASLNLSTPERVRDLWRQKDLAVTGDRISAKVPRHGVLLLRVWPATRAR